MTDRAKQMKLALDLFKQGVKMTGLDGLRLVGTDQIRTIVCKLEKEGHKFTREKVVVMTRFGAKELIEYGYAGQAN